MTAFEITCRYCDHAQTIWADAPPTDDICGDCQRVIDGEEKCLACDEWTTPDLIRTKDGIRKCYECWSDPDAS